MKPISFLLSFLLIVQFSAGQSLVKIGDKAPKYNLNKVINAPIAELNISELNDKPTVLAFWGTWCSPCIPEMINLGKLQKKFDDKVQIIGVSSDNEQKLKKFLLKRPSKLWFASDPTDNLWGIFDLQTAGHVVLIDKQNKVVGITETRNIDSLSIAQLINSDAVNLAEDRGTKRLANGNDPVKLDSTTLYSFVLQPELRGVTPMMRQDRAGAFAQRRITIINLFPLAILHEAFDISIERIFFSTNQDSLTSNTDPFCIDFIVPEREKKDLKTLFQNELNKHLPVKGEIQKKEIMCYSLRKVAGKQILINQSSTFDNRYSFNGLEFNGQGIPIKSFIKYLENELSYPVYDATGLTGNYDLKFKKDNIDPLRTVKINLEKLGLELVKDRKKMDVLVISKR